MTVESDGRHGSAANDTFYSAIGLPARATPSSRSRRRHRRGRGRTAATRLFDPGDGGYYLFFSPNLAMTKNGSVLAVAEARTTTGSDQSAYAIVMRRSLDDGAAWSSVSTIYAIAPGGTNTSAILGRRRLDHRRYLVLFCQDNDLVYVVKSGDDGLTWTTPRISPAASR